MHNLRSHPDLQLAVTASLIETAGLDESILAMGKSEHSNQ